MHNACDAGLPAQACFAPVHMRPVLPGNTAMKSAESCMTRTWLQGVFGCIYDLLLQEGIADAQRVSKQPM